MPLNEYLKVESIIADMSASTKEEALEALVEALENGCPGLDRGSVLAVLHEREALGSTGIGDGVAIPHGKVGGCGAIAIAVGRSVAGCDFEAVDGKNVMFFA